MRRGNRRGVIALIFATLVVVAPDGWIEAPDRVRQMGAVEAQAFQAPDDPEAFYLVMRVQGDPQALINYALRGDGGSVVSRDSRAGDGRTVDDLILAHEDGSRTHIRMLVGSRPGTLIGLCHGASLSKCETKLDLLTVQVDRTDVGYIFDLLLWGALGLVALGIVGHGVRVLLRRRRLAHSPQLLEGTQLTISGVVQSSPVAIEAALSGKRCVMHRSRARVLVNERLLSQLREVEIRPFVVDTRHGPVRVDVQELALEVPPDSVVDHATPRQLEFRARHAIPRSASVAFDEIVIEPGSKVSLRGVVTLERDPDATAERGYRDDAPTTIRLVGDASQPLTLLRIW